MPLDTVLCLDTSGSMGSNNNEGINQLKAAASKFLDGVEDTARQAGLQVTSCFLVFKWGNGCSPKRIIFLTAKDID